MTIFEHAAMDSSPAEKGGSNITRKIRMRLTACLQASGLASYFKPRGNILPISHWILPAASSRARYSALCNHLRNWHGLHFWSCRRSTGRLVAPAEITAVSVFFACILAVQWARRRRTVAPNRSWRVFFLWLLLGYLLSIPFYYRDGGLRVHAAVFPAIAYLLVWLLLPPGNAPPDSGADVRGERISASTLGFGLVLLMSLGWLILIHPKSSTFDRLPSAEGISDRTLLFLFNPGWPQADLSNFPPGGGDGRLRWFSGAMPDDEYRSAGIREISGHGYLYFGFDEATQIWKIIHTDRPIGLLNQIEVKSGRNQGKYRDFYTAERVQVITAR